MTPIEKDKIVALCEKWGLKELNFTKGIFIAEDNSGITVNLRGDNPIVGVTIAGQLHTEGHGNLKAEDYQREVDAIMKAKTSRSSSTEQKRSQSEELLGSNPPVGRINKGGEPPMSSESKPGTPDSTLPPAKLQKAKCKECIVEFELTLDEEKEVKNEKKDRNNKIMEKIMETKITVCGSCGLELSAARALECYSGKKSFRCAECDEKAKAKPKGDKNMDEKLPATTNDSKLTVDVIKQYICPTATDAEAYNFLQLCVHRELNPFLKEAYLIKYGSAPATMVVGKDAFIRKAAESGQYDGFEAGIIIKTSGGGIERRVGVIQYEGDILIGGWAKVFRKDMKYPFVCEVPLTEYMKYKDGKPQSSWSIMPGTMIRKVAVVQGHREAFAKELGGCYDAVEMGTQDNLK